MKAFAIALLILGMFCVGAWTFVLEPVMSTMGASLPF